MAKKPNPVRVNRPTNLVNYFKNIAEAFLAEHQRSGSLPKRLSGVLTPRFGEYTFVWQFENNRLVGAASINVNNVDNFAMKLQASKTSIDYMALNQANQWLSTIGVAPEAEEEVVDE